MTQARNVYELTERLQELAHDSELLGYIQSLFQAADDVEWRAPELECQA